MFHSLSSCRWRKKTPTAPHYLTRLTTASHRIVKHLYTVKNNPLALVKKIQEHWKFSERYKIPTAYTTCYEFKMSQSTTTTIPCSQRCFRSKKQPRQFLGSPVMRRENGLSNSLKAYRLVIKALCTQINFSGIQRVLTLWNLG